MDAQINDCHFLAVRELGFALSGILLSEAETTALIASLPFMDASARRGGLRDVLDAQSPLRAMASHPEILALVHAILGQEAFVVRATLFDKTPDANWKVPWHQDLTIAVEERIETPSFGPWSVKAGVQHVQPPTEVLERMLTVRLHLDDCPASNGALRVMPTTHRLGRLDQNVVAPFVDEAQAVICEARAGEALLMRPWLLHASSASIQPGHRRVLHLDFAEGELPNGLRWRKPLEGLS